MAPPLTPPGTQWAHRSSLEDEAASSHRGGRCSINGVGGFLKGCRARGFIGVVTTGTGVSVVPSEQGKVHEGKPVGRGAAITSTIGGAGGGGGGSKTGRAESVASAARQATPAEHPRCPPTSATVKLVSESISSGCCCLGQSLIWSRFVATSPVCDGTALVSVLSPARSAQATRLPGGKHSQGEPKAAQPPGANQEPNRQPARQGRQGQPQQNTNAGKAANSDHRQEDTTPPPAVKPQQQQPTTTAATAQQPTQTNQATTGAG